MAKQYDNLMIYSLELAKKLIRQGYKVVDIVTNKNMVNGVIFYFNNIPAIQKEIDNYKNK
jgi:hypothetical protein